MLKKRVLIFSLFCLLAMSSCLRPISNSEREPIIIDGTPIENPMAMIEQFARQTAAAQTRIADPYHLSTLQITPIPRMIDGTPYDNPMAAIERFAQQTAVAQTQVVDPSYQPAILDEPTAISPDYSSQRKLLHVILPDGRKISYSPFELGTLPQITILVRNQEVTGVSLVAILQQAGWDAFDVSAVSLNGIGSLTLPKDQITQEYLLVVSSASIKFISLSISESLWIDGVAVIEIY